MCRCWILVGMMGAGKSSIGRALAEASQREFFDTDLLLQHRFGRSVRQIFDVYGEEAFRQHETNMLRTLDPQPVVLATGGGIVSREENWVELRRLGTTVYLETSAERLIERLERSKKQRPLLMIEDWRDRVLRLLEQRQPFYQRADVRVQIDCESISEAAAKVLSAIREHEAQ